MSRKDISNRKHEVDERELESRFEDSRAMDEREVHKRNVMNMSYSDPLYVDPEIIPHGVEYRWIRESCYDKPDNSRMVEAKRKGWTPVPAARHPEMSFDDFFGRLNNMKPYIYHKGLILCERPSELGKIEQQRVEKMNHELMSSMPGTDNFMGEPTIPVRNNSETRHAGAIRQ